MTSQKAGIAVIGSEGGLGRSLCSDLQEHYAIRRVDINCPKADNTFRADVRSQEDMERAVDGCDVVVHLAAFHGGYKPPPTDETRFDVNVLGTFRLLQACLKKGIRRVIWASSTAARSKKGIYPVTKVLGEDLCEYYHLTHGFNVAMLRYGAFTPCDFITYGQRLLGIGVNIRDCVAATVRSIELMLEGKELFGRFIIMPDHKQSEQVMQSFSEEFPAILNATNRDWPGLVDKYGIKIPQVITQHDLSSTKQVLGFEPSFNFATFLHELHQRDTTGRVFTDSPRWFFEQGIAPPEGIAWPEGHVFT